MCWRKHLPIWRCGCSDCSKKAKGNEIIQVKNRLESVRLRIDTLEQQQKNQPPRDSPNQAVL